MKKHKLFIVLCVIVWCIAIVLSIVPLYSEEMFDKDDAMSKMTVSQNEDRVGANIWLKQTVHGEDGIYYRYVVETDCPNWDFETRYVTRTPIDWIDETSAVETIIYSVQIRFGGTIYASGQYYTVPLLGGIASEDISFEEWKNKLMEQAWHNIAQEASRGSESYQTVIRILVIGIPIAIAIFWFLYALVRMAKNTDDKMAEILKTSQSNEYTEEESEENV